MAERAGGIGMDAHLQMFLLSSLVMAAVIALLFSISTLFSKKISAKTRYIVWVVTMMGLLIPLRPTIGEGVIEVPDLTTVSIDFAGSESEAGSGIPADISAAPSNDLDSVVDSNEFFSFQVVLFISWAVVAVGMVSYHFVQYFRFSRSIKRWGEPEEDKHTLFLFDRVKQEMNLSGSKVRLVVCGFVSTSMLTGFLKPMILLPERNYDDEELELIFRHELIHYRRKDLWIKLLSVIATAIHWFNPFVYVMNTALQTEGEASCDQEVLETSQLKNRQFYAEVIIGMIGRKKPGMTAFATNFYGGKKGIKKRLEEIMARGTPRKSVSYAFLALTILLTVTSGSVFAMPTSTDLGSTTTEIPIEGNEVFFQLAINAVGGGTMIDYQQLSDELLQVRVTYEDVTYLVDIDTLNQRVIGLSLDREDNQQMTEGSENETDEAETGAQPPVVVEITREQAGEIALGTSGGRLVEVSRDSWHGRPAWWAETRANGMVHEFYIDRFTGEILEHEWERDD